MLRVLVRLHTKKDKTAQKHMREFKPPQIEVYHISGLCSIVASPYNGTRRIESAAPTSLSPILTFIDFRAISTLFVPTNQHWKLGSMADVLCFREPGLKTRLGQHILLSKCHEPDRYQIAYLDPFPDSKLLKKAIEEKYHARRSCTYLTL